MCVYIYTYIYIYPHTYIYTNAHTQTHMYVCIFERIDSATQTTINQLSVEVA